jgi:hypothetical protein
MTLGFSILSGRARIGFSSDRCAGLKPCGDVMRINTRENTPKRTTRALTRNFLFTLNHARVALASARWRSQQAFRETVARRTHPSAAAPGGFDANIEPRHGFDRVGRRA